MKIGIDLGGSHIGIGLVDQDKIIYKLEKNFVEKDKKDIEQTIRKYIHESIGNILEEKKLENVEMIGVSIPRKNKQWNSYKFT